MIVGFAILITNILCGCQTVAMVQSQSNTLSIADSIAAPLILTISANQRIISDTQPIQITILLTNAMDTPVRYYGPSLQWPVFHVTTPIGETTYLSPLRPMTPQILMLDNLPLLQPHQSFTTGYDLRTLNGYNRNLFAQTGIYRICTYFSQPAKADYMEFTNAASPDGRNRYQFYNDSEMVCSSRC